METTSQILSEIIPPADLIALPSSKSEPDINDLSDLDSLLADSMALAVKAPNRRVLKETTAKVNDFLAKQQSLVAWDVLENIEVWTMTKCKCGALGTMTFVRNMQKLKKVGQAVLHWETVKELPADMDRRFALVEREVCRCEFCAELDYTKFSAFSEVVK